MYLGGGILPGGGGSTVARSSSGLRAGEVMRVPITQACPAGTMQVGVEGSQRLCGPVFDIPAAPRPVAAPAPAPAPAPVINVSPQIQTQVSPQISPQFVQQMQPQNSPVAAGASMTPAQAPMYSQPPQRIPQTPETPRVIPFPEYESQNRGRTYEALVPADEQRETTTAIQPAILGPITQEREANNSSANLPAIVPIDATPITAPQTTSKPNWALYAALAAGGIAVLLMLTQSRKGARS